MGNSEQKQYSHLKQKYQINYHFITRYKTVSQNVW